MDPPRLSESQDTWSASGRRRRLMEAEETIDVEPVKRWRCPQLRVPNNGWFTMENLMKMDDLGVPLLRRPPYDDVPELCEIIRGNGFVLP